MDKRKLDFGIGIIPSSRFGRFSAVTYMEAYKKITGHYPKNTYLANVFNRSRGWASYILIACRKKGYLPKEEVRSAGESRIDIRRTRTGYTLIRKKGERMYEV